MFHCVCVCKNESSLKIFRSTELPTAPLGSHNLPTSLAISLALWQRSYEQTKGDVSRGRHQEAFGTLHPQLGGNLMLKEHKLI